MSPHSDAHTLIPRTHEGVTKGTGRWGHGSSGRDNGPDHPGLHSGSQQSM